MKKIRFEDAVPAGYDYTKAMAAYRVGFAVCILVGLQFLTSLHRERLYVLERMQMTGEQVAFASFERILQWHLHPFVWLACFSLCSGFWQYNYHRQGGSCSLYLMRRLPKKYELLRRCVSLPIAGALLSLAFAGLLLWLFQHAYQLAVPAGALGYTTWGG